MSAEKPKKGGKIPKADIETLRRMLLGMGLTPEESGRLSELLFKRSPELAEYLRHIRIVLWKSLETGENPTPTRIAKLLANLKTLSPEILVLLNNHHQNVFGANITHPERGLVAVLRRIQQEAQATEQKADQPLPEEIKEAQLPTPEEARRRRELMRERFEESKRAGQIRQMREEFEGERAPRLERVRRVRERFEARQASRMGNVPAPEPEVQEDPLQVDDMEITEEAKIALTPTPPIGEPLPESQSYVPGSVPIPERPQDEAPVLAANPGELQDVLQGLNVEAIAVVENLPPSVRDKLVESNIDFGVREQEAKEDEIKKQARERESQRQERFRENQGAQELGILVQQIVELQPRPERFGPQSIASSSIMSLPGFQEQMSDLMRVVSGRLSAQGANQEEIKEAQKNVKVLANVMLEKARPPQRSSVPWVIGAMLLGLAGLRAVSARTNLQKPGRPDDVSFLVGALGIAPSVLNRGLFGGPGGPDDPDDPDDPEGKEEKEGKEEDPQAQRQDLRVAEVPEMPEGYDRNVINMLRRNPRVDNAIRDVGRNLAAGIPPGEAAEDLKRLLKGLGMLAPGVVVSKILYYLWESNRPGQAPPGQGPPGQEPPLLKIPKKNMKDLAKLVKLFARQKRRARDEGDPRIRLTEEERKQLQEESEDIKPIQDVDQEKRVGDLRPTFITLGTDIAKQSLEDAQKEKIKFAKFNYVRGVRKQGEVARQYADWENEVRYTDFLPAPSTTVLSSPQIEYYITDPVGNPGSISAGQYYLLGKNFANKVETTMKNIYDTPRHIDPAQSQWQAPSFMDMVKPANSNTGHKLNIPLARQFPPNMNYKQFQTTGNQVIYPPEGTANPYRLSDSNRPGNSFPTQAKEVRTEKYYPGTIWSGNLPPEGGMSSTVVQQQQGIPSGDAVRWNRNTRRELRNINLLGNGIDRMDPMNPKRYNQPVVPMRDSSSSYWGLTGVLKAQNHPYFRFGSSTFY
jgi:hypothetical protein